jgi:hypothetical protein
MSDLLIFEFADGASVTRSVTEGKGPDELARFRDGRAPYEGDWLELEVDRYVNRAAIVSVRLVSGSVQEPEDAQAARLAATDEQRREDLLDV